MVDLKSELEKRRLETTGVKGVLIERLEKALRDEGQNPEEYLFEVSVGRSKPKPTTPKSAKSETDKKKESDDLEMTIGVNEEDELVIKDEVDNSLNEDFEEVDRIGDVEKADQNLKSVQTESDPKEEKEELNLDTSNIDNEDSLNLTIGEEDEQLLRDEENEMPNHQKDSKVSSDGEKSNKDKGKDDDKNDRSKSHDSDSKSNGKSSNKEESSKTTNTSPSASQAQHSSSTSAGSTQPSSTSTTVKTKITAPSPTNSSSTSTPSALSRNLWVSGLSSLTRATDLKQIFSKYGKVIGAKVVTNTRTPGSRCFGYVTMATAKDATECIGNLHRTELHGRMISVERAKSDLGSPKASNMGAASNKVSTASNSSSTSDGKRRENDSTSSKKISASKDSKDSGSGKDERKTTDDKSKDNKKRDENGTSLAGSTKGSSDKKKISPIKTVRPSAERKANSNERSEHGRFAGRPGVGQPIRKDREVLSYNKIREERERQRWREKERQAREDERRRREVRRRQREEEQRLAREREKLQIERERIEKQKAELIRIERERQKLEREKIELERLELKTQQRKLEEAKRAIKRPISNDRHFDEDRKRTANDNSRRFEAPPPPRFDSTIPINRNTYDRGTTDVKKRLDDFVPKREDYTVKGRDDYKRDNYKRNDDTYKRDNDISRHSNNYGSSTSSTARLETTSINKDRYSDRSTDFRGSGTSSRNDDRDRNGSSNKSRYMDSTSENRYSDRSGNTGGSTSTNWHSGPTPAQFGTITSGMDLWTNNKQVDNNVGNSGGWRSMETSDRYDRFQTNDRKNVTQSSQIFDTTSVRPNQYISSTSSGVMSSGGSGHNRYSNNRYDNGRF